jgi:hypothetical protein
MSRTRKTPPLSNTVGIPPDPRAAAFEKLHTDLISELAPNGALEKHIVATLTRVVWRYKCLKRLLFLRSIKSLALTQSSRARILSARPS